MQKSGQWPLFFCSCNLADRDVLLAALGRRKRTSAGELYRNAISVLSRRSDAGVFGSGVQGNVELIDGHDPVGIVEAFFT